MKNIEIIGVRSTQYLKIERYLKKFITRYGIRVDINSNFELPTILLHNCSSIPVVIYGDLKVYFDNKLPIEVALGPILTKLLKETSKKNKCATCKNCNCQHSPVRFLQEQALH